MLVRILIAILAVYLIWVYLLPLLPAPLHSIAVIVLVVAAIVWLLRFSGLDV